MVPLFERLLDKKKQKKTKNMLTIDPSLHGIKEILDIAFNFLKTDQTIEYIIRTWVYYNKSPPPQKKIMVKPCQYVKQLYRKMKPGSAMFLFFYFQWFLKS